MYQWVTLSKPIIPVKKILEFCKISIVNYEKQNILTILNTKADWFT